MIPARFAPVLQEMEPLASVFRQAGHRLYLVGGTVRDLLLGDEAKPLDQMDFDATTTATPEETKKLVAGIADAVWTQGERFGTIGLKVGERVYEITTHRAEAYSPESRKPDVVFAPDIETDLSRRDFTINAMALELTGDAPVLVDPYGGAADLMTRTLRTPLSPEESFSDDPLRMMRAARFIAQLQVVPEPGLTKAVTGMSERLSIVSMERVRNELDKLMVADKPSAGLWFLIDTGLVDTFFPEISAMRLEQDPIHRHKDVLTHTVAVVENVRPDASPGFDFRITRLAALFHDIGKPKTRGFRSGKGVTFHHHEVVGARMTRDRMRALKYPNEDVDAVSELVNLHLRFHTYQMGWTDSAVRRYVRDAGPLLAELNVLTRCDCTTRNEKKAAVLARRMDELEERIAALAEREEIAAMRPEIDGVRVMELLGIPGGPAVGDALDHLMEIRMEEGLIGEEAATARLLAWWEENKDRAGTQRRPRRRP
ncbi:MAG: CCA tRNA nucleotidyltransferase, partial [Actinobacteria bacterium]|nr:CCA tRNA nucleotidyltransferase [Actinomycetota bacterium]